MHCIYRHIRRPAAALSLKAFSRDFAAMAYSLGFHIVGIVMWLGGMMILTRCVKLFSEDAAQARVAIPALRRLFFGNAGIGAVLVLGSGIFQLAHGGAASYFAQGWFHAKLTLVVILLGATACMPGTIALLASQPHKAGKRAMMLHGISALVLLAAVFLTLANTR
jgi:uncharacterized membrane protein